MEDEAQQDANALLGRVRYIAARIVLEERNLEMAVVHARAAGLSWERIGRAVGISRQAALKRFSGPSHSVEATAVEDVPAVMAPRFPAKSSGSADSLLLTKKEVAGLLGVSIRTIERLTSEGALRPIRVGRIVRYARDEVRDFIRPMGGV